MVSQSGEKEPRKSRACDVCRRRKIACDGALSADHICTVCRTGKLDCTYVNPAKRRWPPASYIKDLEKRVHETELLLQKLFPDVDFSGEIGQPVEKEPLFRAEQILRSPTVVKHPLIPLGPGKRRVRTIDAYDNHHTSDDTSFSETDDDDRPTLQVGDIPSEISLTVAFRTFGKSSTVGLVKRTTAAARLQDGAVTMSPEKFPPRGRRQFWTMPMSEVLHRMPLPQPVPQEFPPQDLLEHLIDVYFTTVSLFFPFLHRGLFEQQIASGLHLTDHRFGGVVLLVCAVASRNSSDPRVRFDPSSQYSAGWAYYLQVEHIVTRTTIKTADLFCLQAIMLSSLYLSATASGSPLTLALINKGIRMAVAVGAHRKRAYNSLPNLVDEMWKRVFWCLVAADRFSSVLVGRACSIHDEDFDLESPLVVHDECWNLLDPAGKYPLKATLPCDQPSDMVYFVTIMKLTQIVAFILRSLYSISKFKLIKSAQVVMEMDSALNEWLDEIPEHLRWNPNMKNSRWFAQSAVLRVGYFNAQMLLHRPFMFQPKLGLPSLAICTNAARSCAATLEIQMLRNATWLQCQTPIVLVSSVVILLDLWDKMKSTQRPSNHPSFDDHWKDLNLCLTVLRSMELSWFPAGKFVDIVADLAKLAPCEMTMSCGCEAKELPHLDTRDESTSPSVHSLDLLSFPIFTQEISVPMQQDYVQPLNPPLPERELSMFHRLPPGMNRQNSDVELSGSFWPVADEMPLSFINLEMQPYGIPHYSGSVHDLLTQGFVQPQWVDTTS
ncbi:fungal-specific transcription factor domain-containing protein [Auriculariales sp. MPI-PUGE-AT-0066]|nr:fungal-specific transcription factor domain-containing protein [Auriculariales sp. MPI-PUGE-AT-0066]